MRKRIVKSLVVSSRRVPLEDDPEQAEVLYLLAANRGSMRESLLQSEELAAEVYRLRRQVIGLSKLVKVRERERDSVKQAHKKRLREAKRLQRYNEKLERWLGSEEELFLEEGSGSSSKPKSKKKKKKNKKDNKKDKKKDKKENKTFAIAASPVDDSD